MRMNPTRRALAEGAVAALTGYVVAAGLEVVVIRWLRPTEWELASVSDAVLATALGVAVYLWRRLLTTRQELVGRERAELVLQTQLSLAAEIQGQLLPVLPPPNGQFECAAALKSAIPGRILPAVNETVVAAERAMPDDVSRRPVEFGDDLPAAPTTPGTAAASGRATRPTVAAWLGCLSAPS